MYKHLFGPVPSRRLGMSLGIDLIPKKVCSLDCVYCEVGKTTKLTTDRLEYAKYDKVIAELKNFMNNNPKIDYISSYRGDVESAIFGTIARRPCTLDDLHRLLGIHVNEINKYLGTLETEGKIVTQSLERGVFYELKHK
jgi:hypothetical protein